MIKAQESCYYPFAIPDLLGRSHILKLRNAQFKNSIAVTAVNFQVSKGAPLVRMIYVTLL